MKPYKAFAFLMAASVMLVTAACGQTAADTDIGISKTPATAASTEVSDMRSLKMKIGDREVDVAWEDNDSVKELKNLASSGLTIEMSMYGGFEQVGPLGRSIARDDKQTTTAPGDIVLYSGDSIVLFYGSNSWSYTRLGKINMTENELEEMLGNGDVTVTLSIG